MREMELDARVPWPFHSIDSERRTQETIGGRLRLVFVRAEHEQKRVREEMEASARAKQPCRLRDPFLRIRPQARAIFRDREVEGLVGVRDRFRVAVDERELELVLLLEAPRGRELLLGVVDADDAGTPSREPRGDICRAAAELDRVLALGVVRVASL